MSNNKQSSVEWYIIERHIIEIQSRLGLISPIEYDAKLIKIEEQAKAMHKNEIINLYYAYEDYVLREEGIIKTFGQFYNENYGSNNEQREPNLGRCNPAG